MEYTINEEGIAFYEKLRKDTQKSIYLAGPGVILFYTFCTVLITGWTLNTYFILIFPISLISYFLYFNPLVTRGKLMNSIITNLVVEADCIEVETFGWYFFKPKQVRLKKFNFSIEENSKDMPALKNFPAKCKIKGTSAGEMYQFYLIREFYDNWEELMQNLKS